MPYLYLHKEIRNDNGCPTCKKYYVSLHNTHQEAYEAGLNNIITDDDRKKFKNGGKIWIDEWIRRRNGDVYQICKIVFDMEYDLSKWDICSSMSDDKNITNCYLLLHISIDKDKWCPDNIIFNIIFYKTISEINNSLKNKLNESIIKKIQNMEKIWINEDDDSGEYYQLIKPEYNKNIYLNELCSYIDPNIF